MIGGPRALEEQKTPGDEGRRADRAHLPGSGTFFGVERRRAQGEPQEREGERPDQASFGESRPRRARRRVRSRPPTTFSACPRARNGNTGWERRS